MELSCGAKRATDMLLRAGFEAYAVGGCVRDSLLGKKPFDFDITTSAFPEETKAVFRNEHVLETGIKHGTVTVLMDGEAIEITTFRIDSEYSDNRHPEKVTFTRTLSDDLSRRDFTVNALAYSEKTGIIDLFGGISDLEHGIIRTVGEADKRFSEDALRIMRALRFSSELGFEIEKETAEATERNRELLRNISAERFFSEFTRLICGKNAAKVLREHAKVIGVLIPEILPLIGFDQRHFRHHLDAFEHSLAVLDNIPAVPVLRMAALFHDIGKPDCFSTDENGTGHFYTHAAHGAEMTDGILTRLRCDSLTKKAVCGLIRRHEDRFEPTPKAVKRLLSEIGPEAFGDLLLLMEADEQGKRPEFRLSPEVFAKFREIAAKILENGECFSLRELKIGGNELIEAGIKPGPEIGRILDVLLEKVISGEIPNEKTALIDFGEKLINKKEE